MSPTRPKESKGRDHRSAGDRVRTLDRGLAVLESVSDSMSLTEIAHVVNLPVSTTHRLLETLRQRRFIDFDAKLSTYSVGLKAFEVGVRYVKAGQLPEVAHPIMETLVGEINESANLAIQDGREAIYIHQVEGNQMVRMFTKVGGRAPLHCSGVGKALIAWQARDAIRPYVESTPLTAFTPHTLTTPAQIYAELDVIKHRGYALDMEEFELGIRCIAAPVRDAQGTVVAALSVSAPVQRFSDDRRGHVLGKVLGAAKELSARLGWAGSSI